MERRSDAAVAPTASDRGEEEEEGEEEGGTDEKINTLPVQHIY